MQRWRSGTVGYEFRCLEHPQNGSKVSSRARCTNGPIPRVAALVPQAPFTSLRGEPVPATLTLGHPSILPLAFRGKPREKRLGGSPYIPHPSIVRPHISQVTVCCCLRAGLSSSFCVAPHSRIIQNNLFLPCKGYRHGKLAILSHLHSCF